MTECLVTRWRELPSRVGARAGEETVKFELSPGLQEAVDEAAMGLGDTGADDYLAGLERSGWTEADGRPAEVLTRVTAELDADWPTDMQSRLPRWAGPVNRLAALLGEDRPVLLDGAMGTLLQVRGLEDGAPGEFWSLENPGAVRAAHVAYAEAGERGC